MAFLLVFGGLFPPARREPRPPGIRPLPALRSPLSALRSCLLLLSLAGAAGAQSLPSTLKLETASDDDRKLLRQIDQMVADQQYDEAVERLRRLMEEHGNALLGTATASKDSGVLFQRYVPLREVCNGRLAQWARTHAEALAIYRRRVDPLAERWLKEAVQQRDEVLLRRVAEQMFASSYGDDALYQLGGMYLEQGRYTAARRAWERISPALRAGAAVAPPPGGEGLVGGPLWIVLRHLDWSAPPANLAGRLQSAPVSASAPACPDTDLELADVRARLALVSILEGSLARAAVEVELVGLLDPDASGMIGGRQGKYVELLTSLLSEARGWTPRRRPDDWLSFAGGPRRDSVAPQGLTDMPGKPLWQRDLAKPAPALSEPDALLGGPVFQGRGLGRIQPALGPAETEDVEFAPPYYPLVIGGYVYINDAGNILALGLRDGKPRSDAKSGGGVVARFDIPAADVFSGRRRSLAFTMSSDGERLLARMGPPPSGNPDRNRGREDHGFLAGINLRTLSRTFEASRIYPESAAWDFEGTPVADDANFYVLMRKIEPESSSVQLYVACYELNTGLPRWRQFLCRNERTRRYLLNAPALLSLDDDTLYVNSNLGCIAAVSTIDGRVRWAFEYRRRAADASASAGPLRAGAPNPCLLHKGMVLAAPTDSDQLLALDAATGELIWATPPPAQISGQLLGVGHGNVIVGGAALWWIDLFGGRIKARFPLGELREVGLAQRGPYGYGRGLLAGDCVYWPTRDKIYIFEQQVPSTPNGYQLVGVDEIDLRGRGIEGGNLTLSQGVLLIATSDHIYAFDAAR